jgi:hypothetical protein
MREMGTAPADNMRCTGWVAGGETGATEEVAGGVVSAVWGTKVEAGVIGVACCVEGKAGVIVATSGMGEGVGVIRQVGGPLEGVFRSSASAMRAVGPPGGAVRPSSGVTEPLGRRAVGLLGVAVGLPTSATGAIRPLAMVIRVSALRRVSDG